ncbi:MAG TPA: hypothetical protein VFG68_22810 [Fimbriiglobus sp.]|nr:hypothetical protein [Fimbriiglobus sp.]
MAVRPLLVTLAFILSPAAAHAQADGPASRIDPPYTGPCADKMAKVDLALALTNASIGTSVQMERIGWLDGETGLTRYLFRFGASRASRGFLISFAVRPDGGCTLRTLDSRGEVLGAD